MATWGTLVTETQRLLDDTPADRWTTAAIYGYLDNAAWEFQAKTEIIRPDTVPNIWVSIILSNGVSTYEVNGATPVVGPILRVEDSNGISLFETTEEMLDITKGPTWRLLRGKPTAYVRSKGKYGWFSVYPLPDATVHGTVLNIMCAVLPVVLATDGTASGASPLLPAQYHQALPYGAAYRCLQWNQDAMSIDLGTKYKERFEEFIQIAQADMQRSFKQ